MKPESKSVVSGRSGYMSDIELSLGCARAEPLQLGDETLNSSNIVHLIKVVETVQALKSSLKSRCVAVFTVHDLGDKDH